MPNKRHVTYDEYARLADNIVEQLGEKDIVPTHVVGLSRGGLLAGVIISHKLRLPFIPLRWSTRDFPEQQVADVSELVDVIQNKKHRLLIVDDICDSGRTLNEVFECMSDLIIGEEKNKPVTAALFHRAGSNHQPTLRAELLETDEWIVFPYEAE